MRTEKRRMIIARLLLAVFLPMLVATTLHTHEAVKSDVCVECVNHTPHAGHLSASHHLIDDCVLCQLSSLPYLAATIALFTSYCFVSKALILLDERPVPSLEVSCLSLRGPPSQNGLRM